MYESLSDEEIITLIRAGNKEAMDFLLDRYKFLVRKKVKALFLIGGDRDDLIQEGMIGLYKAIRDYQKDKAATFFTFADLCIERQMYSAIKTSNTKKNQPLNNYISFDATANEEEMGENSSLLCLLHLAHSHNQNPEELLIDKESTKLLETKLNDRLSPLEREILALYLQELNYSDIARRLDKEPKAIDNGLQRIKKKLNDLLKDLQSV